ncbi:hypothetical protein L1049_001476 [Liquidambar formosana]|uniref:Uncharacterized protein n=1 Tax=Liquidambar formosana TaxID=63359 RepID=A0AAP0R676_LIQFO
MWALKKMPPEDKSSPSVVLELIAPAEKNVYEASLFGESIIKNHEKASGILTEVSPVTSAHGEGFESPQKVWTSCDDFVNESEGVSDVSSTLPSSEVDHSLVSCESKVAEMGFISSSSSLPGESYSLCEISPANFPKKAGEICNTVDAMVCVSDIFSAAPCSESSLNVSREDNIADMQHASSSSVLSLESNGVETSRINEAVCVSGPPGNTLDRSWESTQLESFMSSFEIERSDDSGDDITDSEMETIELCDKVKLEESCVIVDGNLLHAVSCRARKHRSYRKIIQDAFASKKRIAKEYEQLAIVYGDIDTEFNEHTAQNLLPSIHTTPLDSKRLPRHDLCDSEWELL